MTLRNLAEKRISSLLCFLKMFKTGFLKYKAFVQAHAKANPRLDRLRQIPIAQELWKKVKNDPEKHRQMMLEFRNKAANLQSTLLNYWGTVAAAHPAPNPVNLVEVPKPIAVQPIPNEPSTSSEGKLK